MQDRQTADRIRRAADRLYLGLDRWTMREREALAEAERLLNKVADRHCPRV